MCFINLTVQWLYLGRTICTEVKRITLLFEESEQVCSWRDFGSDISHSHSYVVLWTTRSPAHKLNGRETRKIWSQRRSIRNGHENLLQCPQLDWLSRVLKSQQRLCRHSLIEEEDQRSKASSHIQKAKTWSSQNWVDEGLPLTEWKARHCWSYHYAKRHCRTTLVLRHRSLIEPTWYSALRSEALGEANNSCPLHWMNEENHQFVHVWLLNQASLLKTRPRYRLRYLHLPHQR